MKQYDIFKHPAERYGVVVKHGFSWPAFFFTWLWTLVNGLWFPFLMVMVLYAVPFFLSNEILGLIYIVVSCIFGFKGNGWRRNSLQRRGYIYMNTIGREEVKW